MSRFKDLGSFGQQFINQIANEIRSNAESLVNGAFQSGENNPPAQQSGRPAPDQHSSSSSSSTPSRRNTQGPGASSTSSSEANTPDEVVNDWFSHFVRSGGGGPSMGNAGPCGSRHTSTVKPAEEMVCDICLAKFTLWNRKKLCSECKSYFCGSCVSREAPSGRRGQAALHSRTCKRCKILLSDPPVRADLMELRVKDLQRYLVSKKVNTKSCVEKKDLVELIIRQNGAGGEESSGPLNANSAASGISTSAAAASNVRRKVPEERKKSFPNSYVESTHRHDWLEKMEAGQEIPLSCEEDDDNFIVVTPVEPLMSNEDQRPPSASVGADNKNEQSVACEQTPVEEIVNDDCVGVDSNHDDESSDETLVGAGALPTTNSNQTENLDQVSVEHDDAKSEPIKISPNITVPDACPSPVSGSPRRFANQGLVYLAEIQTLDDVQELSVKQAKDILAMNRVNFKGVVEKDELLKYVARLWKQEKQAQVEKESMNDSDLCKICMDNPVDCVMLECGHMCTCTTCGKQMAECPICRQYVVRVVRTFKA